jgi:hypothetical protein
VKSTRAVSQFELRGLAADEQNHPAGILFGGEGRGILQKATKKTKRRQKGHF